MEPCKIPSNEPPVLNSRRPSQVAGGHPSPVSEKGRRCISMYIDVYVYIYNMYICIYMYIYIYVCVCVLKLLYKFVCVYMVIVVGKILLAEIGDFV